MSAPEVVQVILPPPTTVDLVVAGGLDQVSEWGLITGNLPDQTDLQTALDAKLDIARIVNDIDLLGGTVLTLSQTYHDTFNANRTLTFSGTPLNGDIETRLRMYVISPITLTFPSSYRISQLTNPITTLDFPPGYHELSWSYAGGIFWLLDDADSSEGLASWGSITGDITDQTDLVSYVASHGGSFLSYHTARVDPSGNDSTGTIGDLTKPFLTVQAAITNAEALPVSNLSIDIGRNFLFEDITVTSLSVLLFSGASANSNAFNSITVSVSSFSLKGVNISLGNIICSSDTSLQVELTSALCGDVTSTGAATVGVFSTVGACEIANVTAAGSVELDGGILYGQTISAPGFPIYVVHSHPIGKSFVSTDYYGALTINSAGSEVFVTDAVLQAVLACGTLHLKDSRVVGTNNATSTVYEDVLLLPRFQKSIDFDATAGLKLVNDSATPGNSKYYGTDSGGSKGYFSLPAGSGTVTQFNFTNSTGITGTVTTATTTPTLSLALTNAAVGLGSVTNDAQTKAAIVPNTAPTAGQFLAGNAGGTAYAPVTLSGSGATATLSSAGVLTLSAIPNATLSNSAITIAGTSTSLGGTITLDTISGVSSNGFLKRTGANTWTNDSATYITGNQTVTLSGDVTGSGATSITTTLANIPDVTPAVGSILHTNIAAPTSPASGKVKVFTDSTDLRFHDKNSAGTIGTTVVADTGASNNFLTAISTAGAISKAQPAFSNLSGSVASGQMPALTGDVTTIAGAVATTLGNIPTGVTMAGYLAATAIAAPSTPASGIGRIYVDSTSKALASKDDAGVVRHNVQTKATATSNFLTGVNDAGLFSAAQPAFTDISGTWTLAQGDASTATANKVLVSGASSAPTWSTPTFPNASATSGKIIKSDGTNWIASTETYAAPGASGNVMKSDGTNWTSGTISGAGTVTSIATTSPISGGTITGSGTISLLVNVDHAFTAGQSISAAGAASTPAFYLTGSWLTGGTGTTNFPHLFLQATGTTAATTWSTAGTAIGVNAVTGFTGNLIDLKLAGTTEFKVTSAGAGTFVGSVTATGFNTTSNAGVIDSSGGLRMFNNSDGTKSQLIGGVGSGTGSIILTPSSGRISLTTQAAAQSNSYPEIKIDAVNSISLQSAAATTTWNDSSTANSGTVANRYIFGIAAPTLTATGTSVTDTVASTLYIGGAPTASTNTTIGTAYALNIAAGNMFFGGKATTYNNIATAGFGVPTIVKAGRVTAQSAANSNISQFTVGAADGSFEVSMNMNVTAATVLSTSLNCDYTDESNTARTMIFPTTSLSGTFLSGGLITATGAFETPAMHIRCKASTTITLYTAAGTFTSVTYTCEGIVKQTV